MWKDITLKEKEAFNTYATHPLQAFEWGEFRQKTGVGVIRKGLSRNGKLLECIQLTIHRIPRTPFTIGYFPKGNMPTQETITELIRIGKENNCIFIQLEPNVEKTQNTEKQFSSLGLMPSVHPLFTKYTFQLDLIKSEEELLKNMHPKTRYNIRVAKKHEVIVKEDSSPEAFQAYLKLTAETTNRQGFFAHTPLYHRLMWKTLQGDVKKNNLSAHLFVASYKEKILTTWILFVFHNALYYPYGASSSENRDLMASNLMMWETITYGKKLGLKLFDMWGSLGENPSPQDPWFGFHRFKQGYGPRLIEFSGSYDLVIHPSLYTGYKFADKLRSFLLQLKK